MKPIKFYGMNTTFAENQPEYLPLPALVANLEDGGKNVISCWKLSWSERIKMLFTGKLWINSLMYGPSLQPILPEVSRPFTVKEEDDG